MKPNLLLLFTLTISSLVFSAEVKKADPNKAVYGGVTIKEDSTLKKLLSLPSVAPHYETCKTTEKELDQIPGCIWKLLNEGQKAEVQKMFAQEEAKSEAKVEVDAKTSAVDVTANDVRPTTNLTNRSATIGTDYSSDPAVKALSAFFGKKLDEVLNGTAQDIKDKKIVTVDHKKFINLYTSELGKSIVNSFTSYCMETDPLKCGIDSGFEACFLPGDQKDDKERRENIKANIAAIDKADFSAESGKKWTSCIGTITDICYKNTDSKNTYSKQRACLVMDFVKSARKNLIAADQQKKFYDGLDNAVGVASNMKVVEDKDSSADKLTQITSADIDKDIKTANKKTENEVDDCIAEVNNEKCKKFLDINTKNNTDALAELGLKQHAQEEALDKKLGDDKNVSSYLKEEGYTDDQIKDLTSADKIDEVRKKITDRFKAENEAIIKEMAGRISAKTTAEDGKINEQVDSSALGKIKTDLASRNEDLKNLIHFNNIVASYLNITEGEGKSQKVTRNSASLFAEVNSMDKKDSAEMLLKIKQNKDLQDNQTTADFQINDINQILKYNDDPKAAKP
jgi:hypothetical protein